MAWILALGLPAATAVALAVGGPVVAVLGYHAICIAALLADRGWRKRLRRPPPCVRWTALSCALILGGLALSLFLPRPEEVGSLLRKKVFGDSESRFWVFAVYSMLIHCPAEELFWRGVVDPRSAAANGVGFYLQHAAPLALFLGSPLQGLLLAVPAGAAGLWWSWASRRSGTLVPALVSHAAADLAILGIARVLAFG